MDRSTVGKGRVRHLSLTVLAQPQLKLNLAHLGDSGCAWIRIGLNFADAVALSVRVIVTDKPGRGRIADHMAELLY